MGNIGDSFIGKPHPAQGSHGDIQLRVDDSPKIFCKLVDTWYENVLFPAGEGIHSSNKGLVIKHKSKDIISFGQAGIVIDTKATGTDSPLRINNDGIGYSQIIMGGANPEIKLGFAGSGANMTSSIAGSSKISFNMASSSAHMGFIDWIRAGVGAKFALGNTYKGSTDELRLVYDGDPRVLAQAGITLNTNGNVNISPIGGSGFHRLSIDQSIRYAHSGDNTVIVQLKNSDASVVKIPAGAIIISVAAVVHTVSDLSTHNVNIQLSDTSLTAADAGISSGTELLGAGVANTDSTDSASASDIDLKNDPKEVWICRDTVRTSTSDSYVYICNAGTGNGTTNSTEGTLSVVIDYYGMD